MKIYIDADACPVTDIAIKIANENKIECFLLCDTSHKIVKENATTLVISKGNDSVDFALVNLLRENDIAITQDYGLASMCLAKKAYVLNQNGLEYTNENIMYLLETRYEAKRQRMQGNHLKGPRARKREQDLRFEETLKSIINRIKNFR